MRAGISHDGRDATAGIGEGGNVGSTRLEVERSVSPDEAMVDARRDGAELVTALLPAQAAPQGLSLATAPERVLWEYRTELLERGFMGFGSGQVDLRALEKRLDELGADGWELVHATWDQSVRGKRGGHLLLFKRPRAGTQATG
jgi:hypothetical protein